MEIGRCTVPGKYMKGYETREVRIPLLSHKTYFIEIKSILLISEYNNVVWRFGAVFLVIHFLITKKYVLKKFQPIFGTFTI